MKKIIKIVSLICLFFAYVLNVYSQKLNNQMPPQEDINSLNNKIYRLLAKSECYNKKENYKIAHIFQAYYKGTLEKADFFNKAFLMKIVPTYFPETNYLYNCKYLNSVSLICDKDENVRAICYGKQGIWCFNTKTKFLDNQTKIAKMILNPETAFAFQSSKPQYIIIVKYSGEADILIDHFESVSVYPIKEYMEKHWEEFNISNKHSNGKYFIERTAQDSIYWMKMNGERK